MKTQETNFVGNARQIGNKIQVTMDWEDLKRLDKFTTSSGRKLLTVDIIPLKEKSKYGNTHTVVEPVRFEKES